MVTSVYRPYIAEPLGVVMRRGLELLQKQGNQAQAADSFGAQLKSTLSDAGPDVQRQVSATAPASRQSAAAPAVDPPPIHGNPPPGPGRADAPPQEAEGSDRLPPIGADRSDRTFRDFENPIPQVEAELRKLGIDPSVARMELWDEVVVNIGGRLTNHYIRVTLPNGHREDYSIEWTLRNPRVTAADIMTLMRLPPPRAAS